MQTVRLCAAVGTCLLALAVTPLAQEGSVLQVPGEYPTIQAAVEAASPGDQIRVAAGVYNERVSITTSGLRLQASNGVVIDGTGLDGTSPGVSISGAENAPLVGVELAGFEIRNFPQGIVVVQAVELSIHRNDIHHNAGVGVELLTVRLSKVSQNAVYSNGGHGLYLRLGSAHNTVRANRFNENGVSVAGQKGSGIVVTGPLSNDNELLENEVIGNNGWGIMISRPSGPLTGTLVAQNRVHGNVRAGIVVMGSGVSGNTIVQNNATGNSTGGNNPATLCYPFDLFDDAPVNNTWERNLGKAGAGLD